MTTDPFNTQSQGNTEASASGMPQAPSRCVLLESIGEMMGVGGAVLVVGVRSRAQGQPALALEHAEWMESTAATLKLTADRSVSVRSTLRSIDRSDRRKLLGMIRTTSAGGGSFEQKIALREGDAWIGLTVQWSTPVEGRSQVQLMFQDITEHHKREVALRRELVRQDQMSEMTGIGTWTIDLRTNALTWSDQVFRIHEMEPGAMPTVAEAVAFYSPDDAADVEEHLGRTIRGAGRYDLVTQMQTAKGNRVWVHGLAEVERNAKGEAIKVVGSFRDVTKEREAEEKLRASQEQYMFALDGSNDGLWDWDITTDEVYFSPRWKELIGFEDHELPSAFSEWSARVPESQMAEIQTNLQDCLRGDIGAFKSEFQMRHKDGSWRWILSRGKVVARDEAGRPLRMVGTHTDITDQVELRRGLIAAKESAEQAAIAKSEFLATMSHELRTPLNGILGLSQVLLDTLLDEEQSEHLRVIFSSGSALLEILNDILDLSKVESGKVELESIPFSPEECAASTMALMHHRTLENKDLSIELLVDESVPERMVGDPARLRQVLLNLVGNAVKFTEKGTIKVILSTLSRHDGGEDLRIAVHDTGVGISQDNAERLFESFTQGDSSTTRRFGGSGLGLSICRKLVTLMQGTIGCRPAQERGSVFWLEVPIITCDETAMETAPAAPSPPVDPPPNEPFEEVLRQATIRALVVEDNPVNQMVARRMLERLGCTVETVSDGLQAVQITSEKTFDIVFMDCQMPVMDGYAATRDIREREKQSHAPRLPIVAMTANAMKYDRELCLNAGMDDYVAKPVLHGVLKEALLRGVQRKDAA